MSINKGRRGRYTGSKSVKGGTICIVPDCRSKYLQKMDVRISYFQFPSEKKESTRQIYLKWREKIQVNSISCWGKVCELHFKQDCFLRDLEAELTGRPIRKRLKDGAIPTLYLTTEENLIPDLPLEFDSSDLKQCDVLQSMAQKLRKSSVLFTTQDDDLLSTNSSVNIILNSNKKPTSEVEVVSLERILGKIQPKNIIDDATTTCSSSRISSSSGPKALDLLFDSSKDVTSSTSTSKEIYMDKDLPPKHSNSNSIIIKELHLLKQKVSNLTTQLSIQSNLLKNMKRRYDKRETVIKKLRTDLSDLRRERRKLRQREYMRKFKQKKMAEKRKERRTWICQQIQIGKLDKTSLTAVYSNKSFEKLKQKIAGVTVSNSNTKPLVIENLMDNSSVVDNITATTTNVVTKGGQYQIIAILPTKIAMPKSSNKGHRCFVKACPFKTEKGLSYHQLPKNATENVRENWAKVVPEVHKENPSNPVRVCSKHFLPTDFERDLRNELMGLPMRRVLRQGAFPRIFPEEENLITVSSTPIFVSRKTSVNINDEKDYVKIPTSSNAIENTKSRSNCDEKLSKIGREVELLAEIAELQLKLIEKLGRKANLQNFESVLSDPITNQIRISQEHVVKSIKNEVYKKNNNDKTSKILAEFSKDIQVIQDAKTLTADTLVDFKLDLLNALNLNNPETESDGPIAIFDYKGYLHWKPTVQKALEEKSKLQRDEPQMKLMVKSKTDKTRKKMIDEGHKILQKRRDEIEQYKLKIVELKLWKRNWQSKQRSLERQKKLRKLKLDKRRVWIQEQIDKGYMHKSCKVLVHSRAKFPFEDGFVCTSKRLKKAATDDNTAPLIKGVSVAKNGMVYPCRRKIKNPSKTATTTTTSMNTTTKQTFKNVANSSSDVIIPMHVQDEIEQQQPIIEQLVEPIFTIVSPNQEYVIDQNVETVQEIHYLQEPFVENITSEGHIPAVIHYIQLDPSGHELVAESNDTFHRIL